jgi:hypothetical protein
MLGTKLSGNSNITAFAFSIAASNTTIEGFEIYGFSGTAINGTVSNLSSILIRRNTIHDIGRRCTSSNQGLNGIFMGTGTNGLTIEYNYIYNIGRYITGENGCAVGPQRNDHGVYISNNVSNITIAHNLFRNNKSGFSVQLVNGTLTNAKVLNNTFAPSSPPTRGYIVLSGTFTSLQISNNIFHNGDAGPINLSSPNSFTSSVMKNNLVTNDVGGCLFSAGASCTSQPSGTTLADNTFNVSAAFTDTASNDYTLTSSSPAIDAGLNVSLPFNGSAPDKGAFETIGGFSSATVNENNLDVTLSMSLNVPIIPTTTGWTVRVGGVSRSVTSVNKLTLTDSVVRITFSGAVCAGGETWDVSYAQTGATTDSALIGGTLNQELLAFTNQSVTNNCGDAPPPDPDTPYFHLTLDDGTSGTTPTTAEDESANNEDGTLTNGPTWVTGKQGSAVQFADLGDDYIAVAHGSGVNPSTQSLTVCMGVKMDAGLEAATRTYFGSSLGTNQRFFLSNVAGTWSMGIQSSTAAANTDFTVTAGWHYICVVMNSGTDVATLYVDGVAGTGAQSVKSYTSYTLASDVTFGRASGFGDSVSGGVTIDEPRWYNAALSQANIDDLFEIWEQTSPTPTGTYEQKTHKWQRLRKTGAGAAEDFTKSGTTNGIEISVVVGGAVGLVTQIDCTVADCDPSGLKLYYTKNGGTAIPVPDTCASGGVCFYGNTGDSDIVTGTIECCLTGALTETDGSTQFTASAVPLFDIGQDASFVRRSVLKFDSAVAAGDEFCFKEYHQTDVVLNGGYTPTDGACLTIISHSAGVGF